MSTTKSLTRGARATFLRDGHEIHSACDIPAAGAFAVRHLPPGQYLIRDSCGGEQTINVLPNVEQTVILNGDVVGATGAPGSSGVQVAETLNVGRGGGAFKEPGQVAPGESVTGTRRLSEGADPAEVPAPLPSAERPSRRPKDPGSDERVHGAAGTPLVQDAPVRSVKDMMAEARRRGKLDEEERLEEELEAGEAEVPVPAVIVPPERGPEPLEPTLPPGVEPEAA